jgi:hypothetical protein
VRRSLALLTGAMFWPSIAHACAVCFSGTDENRQAFVTTTVVLSFLPLSMIAGGLLWLRRRSRQIAAEDAGPADEGSEF